MKTGARIAWAFWRRGLKLFRALFRGVEDHINIRILHSGSTGSTAQDQGDCGSYGL